MSLLKYLLWAVDVWAEKGVSKVRRCCERGKILL